MNIYIEKLISFKNAKKIMLTHAQTIKGSLRIRVVDALGYITSKKIISPINLPSFNSSAMDGYAIRYKDVKINHLLKINGNSLAGKPFQGNWHKNSVIQITTGALIPQYCDLVIKEEDTKKFGNNIIITKPGILGQNIRWQGENIKCGDLIVDLGVKLSISELPLIASLGITKINVIRKLRVAIFSTGNELQDIGKNIKIHQIYDINRFSIALMLSKLGCEVIDLGIAKDNANYIRGMIKQADDYTDIIISTGGVSIGKTDFIKQVLEEKGKIIFWKVAIKPGKPFTFGHLNKSWFIGLPGNPVSAMVTFYHLAQPFILKCMGQTSPSITQIHKVRTATTLKKSLGLTEFQRGFLSQNYNNEMEVHSTGVQDSHVYSSFSKANCFIILEPERGNIEIGELVQVELFNQLLKS
ncbi:molybdopterin molybdotransferase MoeA [Candidatus Pantoea edessiphila]|uniref:Molybdopterin molybdenumtransferase n=1 Tax=Candidatus Pantoea edessiphila TaxID=2044610 RepID=A0A2P5SX08_9GAMM|nr:molybdopterin molybdotransferase MoeA [Candidatus Pantoea edessiphila]PPI86869.1 molybdopterin molybdotransferase [Candidatus Pantoea edessiphila]